MHAHPMQSGAALYYSRSAHPPRPPRPTQYNQSAMSHSGYPSNVGTESQEAPV